MTKLITTIFLTFFATGASALLYEIVWQKHISNLTGSDWRGNAIILAVFLAALGAGYLFFGSISKKKSARQLFRLTGYIELVVGLWALVFIPFYDYLFFDLKILSNLLLEIFFTTLLIAPAAFCMGGNLPLVTQALSKLISATKAHTNLYLFNTAGAFFGAISTAFYLLPNYGLNITLLLGAAINIIAGLFFLVIKIPQEQKITNEQATTNIASNTKKLLLSFLAITSISGFIALGLQNILMRLLALSMGGTEYVFGLVVAGYIILLSIGTKLLVQKLQLSLISNALLVITGLIIIYVSAPEWSYIFHLIRIQMPDTMLGFYLYHGSALFVLCTLGALAILPLGAILPTTFILISKNSSNYGNNVGLIYAANAAGCFLGCILSGYLGFYFLNLNEILIILILLALLLLISALRIESACSMTPCSVLKCIPKKFCYLSPLLALLLLYNISWPRERFAIGLFHEKKPQEFSYQGSNSFYKNLLNSVKILEHRDGLNASVSVVEFKSDLPGIDGRNFNRSIMINGKSDGNTEGDLLTMSLSALIGASFIDSKKNNSAAVIGYGTGLTSGVLARLPWISNVHSLEISKEVIDFAPYFDFANGNVSKSSKHKFVETDAFYYFKNNPQIHQIIVSQITNFWMAGSEKIYSEEFYQLAKKRLSDDGIFVQWLSLWGLADNTARIAVKTFAENFPSVHYFSFGPSLLMIGSKNKNLPTSTWQQLEGNLIKASEIINLPQIKFSHIQDLLAHEKWLASETFSDVLTQKLASPKLAYLAGRDFYFDRNTEFDALQTDESWQKSLLASLTSLTASFKNSSKSWDFKKIALAACGGNKVNLIEPNWRYSRTPCREAVVELLKAGIAPTPENLKEDFEWFQKFSNDSQNLARPISAFKAQQEISRFAVFYSAFSQMPISNLKWQISICYQKNDSISKECRESFIALLKDLNLKEKAKFEEKLLARDFR